MNVWTGPPKTETGRPENVYSLDTAGLTQLKDAEGDPLRILLKPGTSFTLPDGKGSIEMTGVTRWVKLQMSDTPAIRLVLGSIVAAVLGLCLSLFVRPRRVWARVQTNADGTRLVQIGGLDRADARAGLDTDVTDLATRISEADHNQRNQSR